MLFLVLEIVYRDISLKKKNQYSHTLTHRDNTILSKDCQYSKFPNFIVSPSPSFKFHPLSAENFRFTTLTLTEQ